METLPSSGNEGQTSCNEPTGTQNCDDGPCSKLLPCGHTCKQKGNEVCTYECHQLVNNTKPTFCGHKFDIECHLITKQLPNYSIRLLQFCMEPCAAVLACSHKCSGTCGECAQGRIHTTCTNKCGSILYCGHQCRIPCSEMCQPCGLACDMQCSHSKCGNTCGEECTKCEESCIRRCKHIVCTAKCGDLCTVPPCEEPCENILPCSHPCVGFCGEPCPPLCRICNAAELKEVFLGHEDEDDARFVLLDECKHIIESRGMQNFCEQNGTNGIDYIRCPKCKTLLTSTQRYNNYIKRSIKDVAAIKTKTSGSFDQIQAKRQDLQVKLAKIKQFKGGRVFSISDEFDTFVEECHSLLQPINNFDLIIGKALEAKLAIVENIVSILQAQRLNDFKSLKFDSTPTKVKVFLEATAYVEYLLSRLTKQVERTTKQEIQDFERELNRLQRIAQFVDISESSRSAEHREMREIIYRPVIYSKNYDQTVKFKLEEFQKRMCVVGGLTELERLEILQATTGLQKGHWFKCPNGHIYVIGECGGAMEVAECYECKTDIGGLQHAVLPTNSHAGEMDNSLYPAWSDIANNMGNYDLNDLL